MDYLDPARRKIADFDPLDVMLSDIAVRIQLSTTDYEKAVQHYETIGEWIDREDSPLRGQVELVYPQGGFAIGATVARHATDDEFDIDGMAQLTLPAEVDPERPLSLLYEAIRGKAGSRYYTMTERKTRCITVKYVGMRLDMTPTVRITAREERAGFIFHSKREELTNRTTLWANPYGFAEWFKAKTPADEEFGRFFERRSLDYAQAGTQTFNERADTDPVPQQMPAYRKSRAVIALQLIKRWRNLAYERRYPNRRYPPSVLLAKYIGDHANRTQTLTDELVYQVESMIAVFEAAERLGQRVAERNPVCPEDILTDRWPENGTDQKIVLVELRNFAEKLNRLTQGVPLPEMYAILGELFGERPARVVFDQYIGQHEADRRAGKAHHLPQIGRVPALGAAVAAPAAARATPRNTFFGE
jgi:hypothetical protein